MKTKSATGSYSAAHEKERLEYLLKRKSLELDEMKTRLTGEREVNSLCAAFIMYLLKKGSKDNDGVLTCEVNKDEVNAVVGKYFAACSDGGEVYRITFTEREGLGK